MKIKLNYIYILLLLISSFYSSSAGFALEKTRSQIWVDLYKGEPVKIEEVIGDLKTVQVVYLGETHTIKRHHEIQKVIIEKLIKNNKNIILCIEQMEAYLQKELDLYNNGKIDFDQLANVTRWSERWNNYENYKPVIKLVHNNNGKIIALNAKAEIIKKIGRKGINNLSEAERKQLPDNMVLNDKDQEKLLDMVLKVHAAMNPKMLRPVIEAQMSRDEMMAYIISKNLKRNTDKSTIFVVLGGNMHFSYGFGVPNRVRRRIPGVKDRIILFSDSGDLKLSYHEKAMARDIKIAHNDLRFIKVPIADYLHIVELKE